MKKKKKHIPIFFFEDGWKTLQPSSLNDSISSQCIQGTTPNLAWSPDMGNLACGGGVSVLLSAVVLEGYFPMLDLLWVRQAGLGCSLLYPHHSTQLLINAVAHDIRFCQARRMSPTSFFPALSRKTFWPVAPSLFLNTGFQDTPLGVEVHSSSQRAPAPGGCAPWENLSTSPRQSSWV